LLVDDAVISNVPDVLISILTVDVAADVETEILSSGATKTGCVITGDVKVLLVKVSVVARPTNVSVEVGRVRDPVLVIVEIVGLVKVSPATVVTVAPDAIDVDPSVGAEYELSVPHSKPLVVAELALRTCPFVPTVRVTIESFALPANKSPLALIVAVGIKGFAVMSVESLSTQIVPVVIDVVGALFVNTAVAPVGPPPRVPSESTQIYPFGIPEGVKLPATGAVVATSPPDEGRFSSDVMSSVISKSRRAIPTAGRLVCAAVAS
jgi:hypothetical protein